MEAKKKWYQKTGWIIALLILFFPVGLILMWKFTTWNKTVKWVVTAALLLLFISNMNSSKTATPTTTSQSDTTAVAQATQQPAEPEATPTKDPFPKFDDGTFEVGKNIQPGIYRTKEGSSGCYYSRLAGFGGEISDILANENTDYPAVVDIKATDKGFKSSRCGTWTQDVSQITESKTSFPDGIYIVGTDIEPGTYRNTGTSSCYYSRLAGFSGEIGDIISNENTDEQAIVTIAATDKGFKSSRCGTWKKN